MGTSHCVLYKHMKKCFLCLPVAHRVWAARKGGDAGRALRQDGMLNISGRTELKVVNVPELNNDGYRQAQGLSRSVLHHNRGSG